MSEPSKYDMLARAALVGYGADAVVVLVLGGALGSGCARVERPAEPEELEARRRALVATLRALADDAERGITQPNEPKHRRGSA